MAPCPYNFRPCQTFPRILGQSLCRSRPLFCLEVPDLRRRLCRPIASGLWTNWRYGGRPYGESLDKQQPQLDNGRKEEDRYGLSSAQLIVEWNSIIWWLLSQRPVWLCALLFHEKFALFTCENLTSLVCGQGKSPVDTPLVSRSGAPVGSLGVESLNGATCEPQANTTANRRTLGCDEVPGVTP